MADPARDFRSAHAFHRAGDLDKAEALYNRVLKKVPDQPDALNMLGLIALDRGDPQRAVKLISRAVRGAPRFADAHSNLGNALLAAGRPVEAIESYRRAVALAPGNPDPLYNLYIALRRMNRLQEAEGALRTALPRKPDALDWRRDLASLLVELDRPGEALAILKGLSAQRPNDVGDELVRAAAHYRSGDAAAAAETYQRVTSAAPDHPEAWDGLGLCLRTLGRFEEAEAAFRQAVRLQPGRGETLRNLGLIGKLAEDNDAAQQLSAVIARHNAPLMDRIAARFALGRLLDDGGRYDEAFIQFQAANAAFRALPGRAYDRAAFSSGIDDIIGRSSEPCRGINSEVPIFIVGVPRSGTSLVEQIAASHPQVHGAGELRDIGRLVASRNAVAAATEHLAKLQRYGKARVIDKMPDNIFLLDRIVDFYPQARVIFCRRDRRDTALSCYFTLFASGNLFSYDLGDCAHRIRETERLADHWRATLPLRMITMDYEELVADLEGQSRRLIGFLGLDWDPTCLNFHQTKRAVATASGWQVRQPLYAKSVGRWRHYAKQIEAIPFE